MNQQVVRLFALCIIILFSNAALAQKQAPTITLSVDATDAPRRILHAQLVIPASPGNLTLYYPKWIPGEHGPTGPIQEVTGLHFRANGQELKWRRDLLDAWTFHVEVPAGVNSVEAALDYVSLSDKAGEGIYTGGASATAKMTVLSWNTALFYPAGFTSDELRYEARLRLPPGWKFGTPLQGTDSGGEIRFAPVSLTTLVDSPVIAGQYLKVVPLAENPRTEMDVAADSPAALDAPDYVWDQYKQLVEQAQ
jgi:predicted metalloprotease with PDZ domain